MRRRARPMMNLESRKDMRGDNGRRAWYEEDDVQAAACEYAPAFADWLANAGRVFPPSFLSTTRQGVPSFKLCVICPAIYPNDPKALDFSDESSNHCLHRRHFHPKQHPVTMLGGGSHGGVRQRCRCPTHRRADLHHLVRYSRRHLRLPVVRSLSPTTTIAVPDVHHILLDAFLLISWPS